MKNGFLAKVSLSFSLCLLMLLAGCCINIGGCCKAKYERTEYLSAPIAAGGTLAVETDVGSITIIGADVADCNITATIIARAATTEEAKKLAGKVKIKLEPSTNKLNIKVEKPAVLINRSVEVDFKIIAPKQLNVNCIADVGTINVSNITGRIRALTDVGSISCREVSGVLNLKTDVGSVNVKYADAAPAVCNADIATDVGNIDFTGPTQLSAQLDASTDVGTINTDRPITLIGEISPKKLKGTIGSGEGKLRLKTDVGSIKIR